MLSKSERCVAQHQTYHDSCNSFVHWLRAAREKLATCSDTFGEKSTIMGKIERAKVLFLCCLKFFSHLCFALSSQFNNLNSNSYVDSYEIFVYLLSTVIYRCPDFQRWERVCFDFVWHFKTVPITCIFRLRIKKKGKKMHSSKVSFSQVFSGFKHGSSCEQT